jgi:hypothetical protein
MSGALHEVVDYTHLLGSVFKPKQRLASLAEGGIV